MEAILTNRVGKKLNGAKKVLLASAGAAALASPVAMGIVFGVATVPVIHGQPPTDAIMKFEVASIRPCRADAIPHRKGEMKGDGIDSSPERLHLACTTVQRLIQEAYGTYANDRFNAFAPYVPILGAPKWIDSDLYQIDAKVESARSPGTIHGSMLRTLLEERFKLKVHRETRKVPVFALTVGVCGPKLQPFKEGSCMTVDFSSPDHPPPLPKPGQPLPLVCGMGRGSGNGYDLPGASMAVFCRDISYRLDRPAIDKTGIVGLYNIHLDLSAAENQTDPSLISAAVRSAVRKLGLKLEPAEGSGEFLVIDNVERASEN